MSYKKTFAKSKFLKRIATLSSFVFVSLLFINPDAYSGLVKQKNNVSANFLSNNTTTDTYVVDGSVSDLQNLDVESDSSVILKTHIVQPKESIEAIAQKYNTSIEQIRSLNNLHSNDLLAGQTLYVSPTQGFVYSVTQKTSLMVFANMYNINKDDLMRANDQTDDMAPYDIGDAIIIPNKTLTRAYDAGLVPRPEVQAPISSPSKPNKQVMIPVGKKPSQLSSSSAIKAVVATSSSSPKKAGTVSSRRRNLGTTYGFAAGNCTAYAASKATFAFNKKNGAARRGNANQWLSNAKKAGYKTSSKPSPGAIGVFKYGGSKSYGAGHVVIVESVDRDNKRIKVSDMNYAGRGIVTVRWINMDDTMTRAESAQGLMGFIPVQ